MIELTGEIRERLDNALADGLAVVASYVNAAGHPQIGFYGSVHAYSSDEIAFWVRDSNSAILGALRVQPRISMAYADLGDRVFFRMYGGARIVEHAVERSMVFEGVNETERSLDPEMAGVGVIVALDRVVGRDGSGKFEMSR